MVSIPNEVIEFFSWCYPSSRTMSLASTQLITKTNNKKLPRGKRLPARKAVNLIAICKLTC
jgi:hypothetical protein